MFNRHSLIPWGSLWGRQEEKWGSFSGSGSFRDRFGDHFRVGDHFGVGIISGAVYSTSQGCDAIICNMRLSTLFIVASFIVTSHRLHNKPARVEMAQKAEIHFQLFLRNYE